MNINNHLIHDADIIANVFNSFFSSVAQNFLREPSSNNFTQDFIQTFNSNILKPTTSLYFNPNSTNEINKIIRSLKEKTLMGTMKYLLKYLKLVPHAFYLP
jgi:hypothetical protein